MFNLFRPCGLIETRAGVLGEGANHDRADKLFVTIEIVYTVLSD